MKNIIPVTMLALAATLAIPESAEASSLQSVFQRGNEAFWNGNYEEAVSSYVRLEELGVRSPGLSYNLATAEARLGNLGSAVRHYERAIARDPDHEDATFNLANIRDFIARRASKAGRDADLAPAAGPWRAVLDRFSPRSAGLTFLTLYLAFFVGLFARRFVRSEMPRLTLGVLVGVLLVLGLATGAVTIGKWNQETNLNEAIVLSTDTLDVMEGPASQVKRFSLEEGSRVVVLEIREDWTKIRDDQGRDGWAPGHLVGEI